ncbi:MAG: UvrB/UvrC motif-containing protein [bacterium]|nr:UvrB/UvrC motif-containing protein [bacterium]
MSFFKGDTHPIKKKIKNLMQEAIDHERFERAAKLRDIYLQIDQFTEKQTVEFQSNTTTTLLQIREIGEWRCYVVLNFFEGRLIDVIRHHFIGEDIDQSTMLASLGSEF